MSRRIAPTARALGGPALAAAFLALMTGASAAGGLHPVFPAFYLAASLAAFAAYGVDKAAAANHRRRLPEKTLHLLGLSGGWPGALLAQKLFRHKTRKFSFQAIFWATVVLNCVALVVLLLLLASPGPAEPRP